MSKETAPEKPYEHQEYPKVLYDDDGRTMTVGSPKEHQRLGKGWHDTPPEARRTATDPDAGKPEPEK